VLVAVYVAGLGRDPAWPSLCLRLSEILSIICTTCSKPVVYAEGDTGFPSLLKLGA